MVAFRASWRQQLEQAARTGQLDARLFKFITHLARAWALDTGEIEGVNSVLKRIVSISPAIEWALISARTVIKKSVAADLPPIPPRSFWRPA